MKTTQITSNLDQKPLLETKSDQVVDQKKFREMKTAREKELEEVEGKEALSWVAARNREITDNFDSSYLFQKTVNQVQQNLEDKRKIAYVSENKDGYLYNFWLDEKHVQGVWRRTTMNEYQKEEPKWEVLLDIDHLPEEAEWRKLLINENSKGNWVKKSFVRCKDSDRVMIGLSMGGKDALIYREFDLAKKEFVKNGFQLKEAHSSLDWYDQDTLFITVDDGKNLTKAKYPRFVKRWRRGEPLEKATPIFELEEDHFYASLRTQGSHPRIHQKLSVFQYKYHMINVDDLSLTTLPLPISAELETCYNDYAIITLQKDWKVPNGSIYTAGSVIALELNSIKDLNNLKTSLIFEPTPTCSVQSVLKTQDYLLIELLNNVCSELHRFELQESKWVSSALPIPAFGTISNIATNLHSNNCYITYENSLLPPTLYLYNHQSKSLEMLKSSPAIFNVTNLQMQQLWATSRDGTKVPYFIISPKDMKLDGSNPTQQYGYGAFNSSQKSLYLTNRGPLWVEKGGVFVIANIRGGGEFGPKWHQGGNKKNRQHSIDDFIAISEDLIFRKITSPEHLGIMGGSAGGILVGACMNQRPDLYKAVYSGSGVLDMLHFHLMGAGHKSIGEYGDPNDPETYDILKSFSPFHNISKNINYPISLFAASTKDDRVVPGHSRKMVDKLRSMGHTSYYYENNEGGHGNAANLQQAAYIITLNSFFMMIQLFKKDWAEEERSVLKSDLIKHNPTFFSVKNGNKSIADHVAEYFVNSFGKSAY